MKKGPPNTDNTENVDTPSVTDDTQNMTPTKDASPVDMENVSQNRK